MECCEGVVDPLFLLSIIVGGWDTRIENDLLTIFPTGLAALTWFLRQQVVTFISGRSLHQVSRILTLLKLTVNYCRILSCYWRAISMISPPS